MRQNLPVTSHERTFPAGQKLISTTDLKGDITYANDAFVAISGYSREELVGQHHNIVRHPDMPPAAFKDLWRTVGRGEPWTGLVKNRRKNGDHYWVRANVTPIMDAGRPHGLRPYGDEALGMTRIEAGLPLINVEFSSSRYAFTSDERFTPDELGLGWLLKGIDDPTRPFIGREAIIRERFKRLSRSLLAARGPPQLHALLGTLQSPRKRKLPGSPPLARHPQPAYPPSHVHARRHPSTSRQGHSTPCAGASLTMTGRRRKRRRPSSRPTLR